MDINTYYSIKYSLIYKYIKNTAEIIRTYVGSWVSLVIIISYKNPLSNEHAGIIIETIDNMTEISSKVF